MTKSKTKTYPHTRPDGTTVRVSVPDDPQPQDLLTDALRDNLSPQAIATIIAYLQPAHVNDANVQRQVQWFSELLIQTLGGPEQFNRLADEVGL